MFGLQAPDIGQIISEFQLERNDFDPLDLSEEEFIDEFRNLIKGLLAEGARIPKELMLFVKNFAYLSSVMQELDPEMDLSTWKKVGNALDAAKAKGIEPENAPSRFVGTKPSPSTKGSFLNSI